MLHFFARFFAVIGFIATLLIALGVFVFMRVEHAAPKEPDNVALVIDFDQPIVEQEESSPFDLAVHEETTPLLHILQAIDGARLDPRVKGIVAHFGGLQPQLAQAQEIRAALAAFRTSGKFTYAFGSTYGDFGTGNRAYYLASGFENIWLQPVGAVGLTDLALEQPFGHAALDKIGVGADFMQREEYKSAMESFSRDNFSAPARANLQSVVDDFAQQEAAGIADDHKWDIPKVRQLMAQGPYTADEAFKAGLVTHIGYADELDKELESKAGKNVQQIGVEDYLDYRAAGKPSKEKSKAKIALIYGSGLISDHDVGASSLSGGEVMGADTVAGAFDDAADDKDVKAIIFRIDSPGGSPEASETIRHALVHAQEAGKPVFVTMSNVAASGGYWVAMNADRIIAEPGTLTGSIGVVGGKFLLGGLMQKLGVSWDTISTGDSAGMWSMINDYTPAQKDRVNALLDDTYRAFTQNVAIARKIPIDKMPDIAKGRVWTGAQAVKVGLVDELGGYGAALAAARAKLGLKPSDIVTIEQLPAPETPTEKIMHLLKGIGLESLEMHATLGQWQNMKASFGPFLRGFEGYSGTINARAPVLPEIR
jgi:protease-4